MIEVRESFLVPADSGDVWAVISDPDDVVSCIPGATLEERHEDDSYSGSILVQFGPAKVRFRATVTFETDDAARIGRVTGRGKDGAGGTRANMAFTFSVAEGPDGSTVSGEGQVDVKGKLAGMIEAGASVVVKRMLGEFSKRLTERCTGEAGSQGAKPKGGTKSWGLRLKNSPTSNG